jgi:HEAT repeat protein
MRRNQRSLLPVVLAASLAFGESDRLSAGTASPEVAALQVKLAGEATFARRMAVEKLGRLGSDAGAAVPNLISALQKDPDDMVRARSAWALGEIKRDLDLAVAALLHATLDANPGVRANSIGALQSIGSPAIPQLEDALAANEAGIRISALRVLWGMGRTPNEASLKVLRTAFDNPSSELKKQAAACAALAGDGASPLVPGLGMLLNDPEAGVRETVAATLAKVDTRGESERGLVQALRKDSSKKVRLMAAIALGKIGNPTDDRVPALVGAFEDSDSDVRTGASQSIARLSEAAVPHLLESLKSNKSSVRELTVDSLLGLGEKAKPAIDPLIELLRSDPDEGVRFRAAGALGAVGNASPQVLEALEMSVAGDKDETVRSHASGALRALRPGVQVPSES